MWVFLCFHILFQLLHYNITSVLLPMLKDRKRSGFLEKRPQHLYYNYTDTVILHIFQTSCHNPEIFRATEQDITFFYIFLFFFIFVKTTFCKNKMSIISIPN